MGIPPEHEHFRAMRRALEMSCDSWRGARCDESLRRVDEREGATPLAHSETHRVE
jgi:hypothetical protein